MAQNLSIYLQLRVASIACNSVFTASSSALALPRTVKRPCRARPISSAPELLSHFQRQQPCGMMLLGRRWQFERSGASRGLPWKKASEALFQAGERESGRVSPGFILTPSSETVPSRTTCKPDRGRPWAHVARRKFWCGQPFAGPPFQTGSRWRHSDCFWNQRSKNRREIFADVSGMYALRGPPALEAGGRGRRRGQFGPAAPREPLRAISAVVVASW